MKCPDCMQSNQVRSAQAIVSEQTTFKGSKDSQTLLAFRLSDFKHIPKPSNTYHEVFMILMVTAVPFGLLTAFMLILSWTSGTDLQFLIPQVLISVVFALIIPIFLRRKSKRKEKENNVDNSKQQKIVDRWNLRVMNGLYCLRCGIRFDSKGIF